MSHRICLKSQSFNVRASCRGCCARLSTTSWPVVERGSASRSSQVENHRSFQSSRSWRTRSSEHICKHVFFSQYVSCSFKVLRSRFWRMAPNVRKTICRRNKHNIFLQGTNWLSMCCCEICNKRKTEWSAWTNRFWREKTFVDSSKFHPGEGIFKKKFVQNQPDWIKVRRIKDNNSFTWIIVT